MAVTAKLIDQDFNIPSCSFFVDGCYSNYILWYFSPTRTKVDIWEFDVSTKNKPVGLQLDFAPNITHLGCICRNELKSGYILYLLADSGIAYRLIINDMSSYRSSYTFLAHELVEIDTNMLPSCRTTCLTATSDCLAIGRVDGSVCCFPIGIQNAQGFRLDISSSSSQLIGDVKNLALAVTGEEVTVVVVLHIHGVIQVWDLRTRAMVFSDRLNHPLGKGVLETNAVPSKILYNDHVGQNVVSNRSILNQKSQSFIIVQEKSELRCGKRVMETAGLLEWISPWFSTAAPICSGDFLNIPRLKFVNWEFNGGFNYPHQEQPNKLCWLYTMCDQLEAMYMILNPSAKPIRLSKQYILDHIPAPDNCFNKAFGREITRAYGWAVEHPLVLEGDYDYPYVKVRESQREVKAGPRLRIGDLIEHSGDKQRSIENAISQYPVAASIYMKTKDLKQLEKKPSRPYCLLKDPHDPTIELPYGRHAVVLSGMVSYPENMQKLDSYFVKDPQYTVPSGRFFLQKFYSLRVGEYNALRCVVYPGTLSLD